MAQDVRDNRRRAAVRTRQNALNTYLPAFRDPAAIHASCEDYRAGASIDLQHDEEDRDRTVACPVLVLWGQHGFVGNNYDVLALWRRRALSAQGHALPVGHFVVDEAPQHVARALLDFLDA